jgi:hypothetical protein
LSARARTLSQDFCASARTVVSRVIFFASVSPIKPAPTAGRGRGSRLSAGRVRPGLTGGERFEKDLATAFFVLADATH